MQVKREAKIYKRSLPCGNTTFRVDVGTINGKRTTKDFRHEVEALKRKAQWDTEIQRRNLGALQDLASVNKREIFLPLERLVPFNASILEAADFYIRYAMGWRKRGAKALNLAGRKGQHSTATFSFRITRTSFVF